MSLITSSKFNLRTVNTKKRSKENCRILNSLTLVLIFRFWMELKVGGRLLRKTLLPCKKLKIILIFLAFIASNIISVSVNASDGVTADVSPWEYRLCQPSLYPSTFAKECDLWTEGNWAGTSKGCLDQKNPMPWSTIDMVIAKAQLWDGSISGELNWSAEGVTLPYNGCWSNAPTYSPIGHIETYNVSPLNSLTVRRDRTVTCPGGMEWDGSACMLVGVNPYRNNQICTGVIRGDSPSVNGTNPINTATGSKLQQDRDIISTSIDTLGFKRFYSSNTNWSHETLGNNWRHTYLMKIQESIGNSSSTVTLFRSNGDRYYYNSNTELGWKAADPDINGSLRKLTDDNGVNTGWEFTNGKDITETYDSQGRLLTLTDLSGNTETLAYDINGRLISVTDNLGRTLSFTYYEIVDFTKSKIHTITDYANRVYTYHYTGDLLTSVDYPDSTSKIYLYEDSRFPSALTGITDRNETRYATWTYDSKRRANSSGHAGGIDQKTITYNDDGTTTITDGNDISSSYTYQLQHGVYKTKQISGPGCSSCDLSDAQYTYDEQTSDVTSKTLSGLTATYSNYDSNGNPGTIIEADGTPKARQTDYTYDPRFHSKVQTKTEPSVFAEGNKVTTYTYDAFGNITQLTIDGFTPSGTPVSRTISMQYQGPLNQLSEIDGPHPDNETSDITTLDYYPNEASQDNNRARLKSITTAEGIVLRSNIQYSVTGKVLSEQRPNGVAISNTYYSGNDRLETTTETADGVSRTTRWTYLATGEVKTVTSADGTPEATTITLGYDDARRLTSITDGLGNYIKYTLDTEGNQTNEAIYDAANVLHKSLGQTFDAYNRLDISTQANETSDIDFNTDGTLGKVTDGNSKISQYSYDELKRLSNVTQDQGGSNPDTQDALTQYGYDIADRLTSVTDPVNGNTTYVYDDLGNLLSETSPDTGTKTYNYDEAGNVISLTDAKEQAFTYSYDGLNRLTSIDAPGTDDDTTYTYDSCANGIGQLCAITNPQSTTDYSYNGFGEISSHQGISYTYDNAGRSKIITYPSGAIVTYSYDSVGQVSQVSLDQNGQKATLADKITYTPFGPVNSMTYGNGKTLSQSVDEAYRLSQQNTIGVLALDYTQYDANGNLLTRVDTLTSTSSDFTYDELNRLGSANGIFGEDRYGYDRNGNRTSYTRGSASDSLTYLENSNRLSTYNNASVSVDANGNITAIRDLALVYNSYSRLIDVNSGVATYQYNGLGQRISKTAASLPAPQPGQLGDANNDGLITAADRTTILELILGTSDTAPGNADCNQDSSINVLDLVCLNNLIITNTSTAPQVSTNYVYSLNGQLMGEYDDTNTPINEYIYLNGQPLAILNKEQVYYVHNDHLGTPQKLTNTAGSVVWSGEYDPFGNVTLNEDVDGDGNGVIFNVRFPGQYYDQETGLHYNYYRYYDPSTGRYITSDPIGLEGGLNTYGYVGGNPLYWIDPYGLCGCKAKGINGIGDKKSNILTHWWGLKRNIKCTYECTDSKGNQESVRGSHTEISIFRWDRRDDRGNEGDCRGAVFKSRYDVRRNREIFSRTHFQSFSPKGSGVPELEKWAKENCKDGKC